ncbi:unnamed protein product [Spirodela intermedia]|uniref:Uncharacterized protein n=1 Tax=Spirodela intermedia TaxID=51605 RepID=A0A7I8L725_SPIIN|nr:unnamed protein product [Spirodela intermedia]
MKYSFQSYIIKNILSYPLMTFSSLPLTIPLYHHLPNSSPSLSPFHPRFSFSLARLSSPIGAVCEEAVESARRSSWRNSSPSQPSLGGHPSPRSGKHEELGSTPLLGSKEKHLTLQAGPPLWSLSGIDRDSALRQQQQPPENGQFISSLSPRVISPDNRNSSNTTGILLAVTVEILPFLESVLCTWNHTRHPSLPIRHLP